MEFKTKFAAVRDQIEKKKKKERKKQNAHVPKHLEKNRYKTFTRNTSIKEALTA